MTSPLPPFSPHQLMLLSQSCYGDPLLPQYLERTLTEGPGDYDWPPRPGTYVGEQIPLWERVFAQIWHQGSIYPATYVAVPVWCEVVLGAPELNHSPLLELICLIEESRERHESELAPVVGQKIITAYNAALQRLLLILPDRIEQQENATTEGRVTAQQLLRLQAFALGKR
ncbi:hypothetical protein [Deinococcus cavernae]|nr:hypothetical protein [Deinococcus cavernae]